MISLIMKKGTFKKEDVKRKKEKCDNLDGSKREQIKKKGQQRKKKSTITLVKMKKNS